MVAESKVAEMEHHTVVEEETLVIVAVAAVTAFLPCLLVGLWHQQGFALPATCIPQLAEETAALQSEVQPEQAVTAVEK